MKGIKFWAGLCCVLALSALVVRSGAQSGAAVAETESVAALRQQFQREVSGLRAEVIAQGIEFQEWKIKQLERELQRVEADDRRLEEAEQGIFRQLAEIEQSIEPSAQGENRPLGEMEGAKAALSGTHLKGLQQKRQPLAEQASELRAQLRQEQQRLDELRLRLKQLKAAGANEPGR